MNGSDQLRSKSSNRRSTARWRSALALPLGLLLFGPSCSDTTNVTSIPHAKGCESEADCDKGLTCTKRPGGLGGLCHTDCKSSANCSLGERCVQTDENKLTSPVCQLASEAACLHDSDCFVPLKCGPDQQCREECEKDYDCVKPQICANQGYCAEAYELDDGKDLLSSDGGNGALPGVGSGGSGGSSSTGGTGATDTGGGNPGGGEESSPGGASGGGTSDAGASGSGGSAGSGGRPNPCQLDSSSCNPLNVVLAGDGHGRVSSDPVGLDCGATCTAKFPTSRAVVLSAFPDQDSAFDSWSGGGCTGDRTCSVTPNAAPTITATFRSITGPVVWIKTQPQVPGSAAVYDPDGNVIVTGTNTTQVDLGAPSPFEAGTFVVKYTPQGNYLWDRRFAGNAPAEVATDSLGNVLFAGNDDTQGGLALGSGAERVACGGNGLLIAKFAAANGARLWAKCYPGITKPGMPFQIVPASNGDLVVVGDDPALSRLDLLHIAGDSGATIWSQQYPNSHPHWSALALDGDDNIFVGGYTTGGDLGGGPITVAGGYDGFIMKRTGAGAFKWAKTFGGTQDDYVLGLTTDAQGDVAFTGRFRGQVELTGFPPLTSKGGDDIVAGKYDADGTLLWVKQFGTAQDEDAYKIVALANGDFLVVGNAESSLDFGDGDGPLFAPGKREVFLVQLSGDDGHPIWSKGYGSPEDDDLGIGLPSVDADGNLLFVSVAGGPIDFGSGPTASGGSLYVKMKLPTSASAP